MTRNWGCLPPARIWLLSLMLRGAEVLGEKPSFQQGVKAGFSLAGKKRQLMRNGTRRLCLQTHRCLPPVAHRARVMGAAVVVLALEPQPTGEVIWACPTWQETQANPAEQIGVCRGAPSSMRPGWVAPVTAGSVRSRPCHLPGPQKRARVPGCGAGRGVLFSIQMFLLVLAFPGRPSGRLGPRRQAQADVRSGQEGMAHSFLPEPRSPGTSGARRRPGQWRLFICPGRWEPASPGQLTAAAACASRAWRLQVEGQEPAWLVHRGAPLGVQTAISHVLTR